MSKTQTQTAPLGGKKQAARVASLVAATFTADSVSQTFRGCIAASAKESEEMVNDLRKRTLASVKAQDATKAASFSANWSRARREVYENYKEFNLTTAQRKILAPSPVGIGSATPETKAKAISREAARLYKAHKAAGKKVQNIIGEFLTFETKEDAEWFWATLEELAAITDKIDKAKEQEKAAAAK